MNYTPDLVDVLIICALHKLELDKVHRLSGTEWWRVSPTADDPHAHYRADIKTDHGKTLKVISAAPNQMGLSASAVLATKLIWRFRPRLVAMVGIAAGVCQSSQEYGDIIAADQTHDYGAGKLNSAGDATEFLPDPRPNQIGPRALSILKEWERLGTGLHEIQSAWMSKPPRGRLRLHVGPLASGAAVLNDRKPIEETLRHFRKLAAVEMEAYAVHLACCETAAPAPEFLCFKSVCDFASEKKDDWQDYAAYTAAAFAWRFIRAEYEALVPTHTTEVHSTSPTGSHAQANEEAICTVLQHWIDTEMEFVLYRSRSPGELEELLHLPAGSANSYIAEAVRRSHRSVRVIANTPLLIRLASSTKDHQ